MNKFCSIFSQLLQLFPRNEFHRAVKETVPNATPEASPAGANSWPCSSASWAEPIPPREITGGLRSCEGKLKHLGITAPSHSTLAYANEHRPWQLFQEVFSVLLARFQSEGIGKKKFRFKNKLASLDSTIIDLSVSLFNWALFRH